MIELYIFIGLSFLRLFVVFAVLMKLKERFGTPLPIKALFAFGVLYDWFVNHLLTLVFLDSPVGWDELVTGRMKRYKAEKGGWRHDFAVWFCPILNKYDEGHC